MSENEAFFINSEVWRFLLKYLRLRFEAADVLKVRLWQFRKKQ